MWQGFNMHLLVFGAFVATKDLTPSSNVAGRRRRAASRSPSPAATRSKQQSKKGARTSAGSSSADDDSAAIYLYGHVPDASSFLSAFYRYVASCDRC
eukprot:COSAG02_NODE_6904_length_3297_cov_6.034396_2_plen_97_part_00